MSDEPEASAIEQLGSLIAIAGVAIPAAAISGFLDIGQLPAWAWTLISSSACAIGGALTFRPRVAAALAGVTLGISVPVAILLYTMLRVRLSETFLGIEFVIPVGLGMIPGALVFEALGGNVKDDP